jgi:membrane protein required for colicin V production
MDWMAQQSMIDLLFAAILAIAVLMGVYSGMVKQIITIACLVGGVVCTFLFQDGVRQMLLRWIEDPWAGIVAYFAIFFTVATLLRLIGFLIQKFMEAVKLRPIDRILGGVLGLLKGLIVTFVIAAVLHYYPVKRLEKPVSKSRIIALYFAGFEHMNSASDNARSQKIRDWFNNLFSSEEEQETPAEATQ